MVAVPPGWTGPGSVVVVDPREPVSVPEAVHDTTVVAIATAATAVASRVVRLRVLRRTSWSPFVSRRAASGSWARSRRRSFSERAVRRVQFAAERQTVAGRSPHARADPPLHSPTHPTSRRGEGDG